MESRLNPKQLSVNGFISSNNGNNCGVNYGKQEWNRNSPSPPPLASSHRGSLGSNQMFLAQSKVCNNRRHSSEVKNILPKISISRAKSDHDLVFNSATVPTETGTSKEIEKRRTSIAIKTLASYVTIKPNLQLKEHNYQSATKMLKANKCRICSETIYFHCYECVQCKLIGHKKCLYQLYVKCPNKPMPPRIAIFGLNISDGDQISEVLSVCIREIEKRQISKLKCIYKTEGNRDVIENLCLSFEFGPHLVDLSQVNAHDIAGIVKLYLAKLSTPIFTDSIQNELITIGKEWPNRKVPYTQSGLAILIFELRRLISYLSSVYRNNLAYLIFHLKRITDKQNHTEMSANSLAIVFANIIFKNQKEFAEPSIGEEPNGGVHIVLDATFKIRVLELIILYVNEIFW